MTSELVAIKISSFKDIQDHEYKIHKLLEDGGFINKISGNIKIKNVLR